MDIDKLNNSLFIWGALEPAHLPRLLKYNGTVIIPEMRPYMIGLKHNLPLLKKQKISAVYCTDNMLGILLFKRKISEVVILYHQKREDGISAASGALYTAQLASLHGVKITLQPAGRLDYNTIFKDHSAAVFCGKPIGEVSAKETVTVSEDFLRWEDLPGYEKDK